MNFQQIKTFCSVYETGSMTAAAKALHLTQPAVSQQIHSLEEELDSKLFLRGPRKMSPLTQGRIFYRYALQILKLSQKAILAVNASHKNVLGTLRVGTLNSIGLHFIGPVFTIFLRTNPHVRLKLQYGSGEGLLNDIKKGDLDIAIAPLCEDHNPHLDKGLKALAIRKDRMVLVESAKALPSRNGISIESLNERPFVKISDEYIHFNEKLDAALKAHRVTVDPVFESSNVGTLKRIIETDIGWGFLPEHSIIKQIQAGRLREVAVTDFSFNFNLACFTRDDVDTSKTLEVFIKGIREFASEKDSTS